MKFINNMWIMLVVGMLFVGCSEQGRVESQNNAAGDTGAAASTLATGAGKTDSVGYTGPAGRRMLAEDFSSSLRSGVTVVYFAKVACPSCERQDKIWKKFINKLPTGVNAEKRFTYAVNYQAYGVRELPTIIVYDNGVEVDRHVGVMSEAELNRVVR